MITILLFAQLQENVGASQIMIEQEALTIERLKEIVQQQYPALFLRDVMTAVNEEFVLDEEIVRAGDVVAFIPPVSGG